MAIVGRMPTLKEVYQTARAGAQSMPAAEPSALQSTLERACGVAREAWPDVPVDELEFCEAMAAIPTDPASIADERLKELALGLACGRGHGPAIERLEAEFFDGVRGALASMKLDDDTRDEVLQEVRRKLLVGDPPKIVGYAGRGSLRGLLKVTATRTAISLLRRSRRESPGDEALLDQTGERDPELEFLKARYRGVFKHAFEQAVSRLEPHERNLLRLHFLRRVTLEALAKMYGVHRATIVRRLAKIRSTIERSTQDALREQLGVDGREVRSVMDLIRSRFDVSVERLLRTMDE